MGKTTQIQLSQFLQGTNEESLGDFVSKPKIFLLAPELTWRT